MGEWRGRAGGVPERKKKVTGGRREERGRQGQEGDDLICFQPCGYPSSPILSAAYCLCAGDRLITLKHFSCPFPGLSDRSDRQELPWPLSPPSLSPEALQAPPTRKQSPHDQEGGDGKGHLGPPLFPVVFLGVHCRRHPSPKDPHKRAISVIMSGAWRVLFVSSQNTGKVELKLGRILRPSRFFWSAF